LIEQFFFIEHYFISPTAPTSPPLDHLNGQSFSVFIGQLLIELLFSPAPPPLIKLAKQIGIFLYFRLYFCFFDVDGNVNSIKILRVTLADKSACAGAGQSIGYRV